MKLYCEECSIFIGEVLPGSKLRIGVVYLCKDCNTIRLVAKRHFTSNYKDLDLGGLEDLFGFNK